MQDLIALTTQGFLSKYRYIVHEGGTRSGKTHSILSVLYHIVNSRKEETVASVISETMPHLRRGAIRDYKRILQSQHAWNDATWNKTDSVQTLGDNKLIEFFSAENSDKVHGPERDFLFINEAQNVSYEIARHLFVRTRKTVFIDFNPVREFWVHEELKNDPKTLWIHSTYKDNSFLTQEQVDEIERNRNNRAWWAIYGEGRVAESEEAIYKGWNFIDSIPPEARLERYGLDFGYTNDPSAIVSIWKWNDAYIINEEAYTKGLSNKQIADLFTNLPRALIIADSAEPKSIDEIKGYGHLIVGSQKGPGSVNQGIQYVQEQKIFVTKTSINTIKEYRNYMWLKDKDGKILNEPSGVWDHTMSSIRYGLDSFRRTKEWKPSNVGGMTPYISGTLA